MRKALINLLVSGLILISSSCYHNKYHFSGKIGEDKVNFYEDLGTNVLIVKKQDGSEIAYIDDRGDDLKVDYVEIIYEKGRPPIRYFYHDIIGKDIIENKQKEFDSYLAKILKVKNP